MAMPPPAAHPPPGWAAPRLREVGDLGRATIWLAVALTVLEVMEALMAFRAQDTYIRDRRDGTLSWTAYDTVTLLWAPLIIAAYVVTCLWLWYVRKNVEILRPQIKHARRRGGWVWAGWLVPVVSFWFPYQIVRDVGTVPPTPMSPASRPPRLGLWWGAWLGSMLTIQIGQSIAMDGDERALEFLGAAESLSAALTVLACVLWVRVVRHILADQARWGAV